MLNTLSNCPWCAGSDKNYRPLRFGLVPCANSWHHEDAKRANDPCKKHGWIGECPYCEIDKLKEQIRLLKG